MTDPVAPRTPDVAPELSAKLLKLFPDADRLVLDKADIREIRLCAESSEVAHFARHARPCVVEPERSEP